MIEFEYPPRSLGQHRLSDVWGGTNSLSNPYAEIVAKITDGLSPSQRDNAINILQLFADSCSE